jgi:hypothetical protein
MNKSLLVLLLFIITTSALASDFCARSQQDLKSLLKHEDSRIAFKNNGGLFNGGVCWWHSRFQRAASYLVKFNPNQNPPSKLELKKILHSLRAMDKVVTIPGYSDFKTFSHDYQKEIQAVLNSWQRSDGFFNFAWIRGISGSAALPAREMRLRMNNIYNYYKKSPAPVWIMAQIKGIESHAMLIMEMIPTATGYSLSVIDSNHPVETVVIEYSEGDQFLHSTGEKYSFVPYSGFQNDFRLISKALKKECGHLVDPLDLEGLPSGDVELSHLQY